MDFAVETTNCSFPDDLQGEREKKGLVLIFFVLPHAVVFFVVSAGVLVVHGNWERKKKQWLDAFFLRPLMLFVVEAAAAAVVYVAKYSRLMIAVVDFLP